MIHALPAQIDDLLAAPTFALDPEEHHGRLFAVLRSQLAYAADRHPALRNYFEAWPIDYRVAEYIADLPYLPVGAFKADPPLMLVDREDVVRTLTSSATSGQTPSRVALDAPTSKRMVKGVASILRDFIGPRRRPYLVLDAPETLTRPEELGARGAAIQGLRSFATQIVCAMQTAGGELTLDEGTLFDFVDRWRQEEVLLYGFTYVVWQHFVQPLKARGIRLTLPHARLLHSGGWKRLEDQAVSREAFIAGVASALGCVETRVLDFYGMVENVGVVYPDCEYGYKHVPAFAQVIVRDPLTLQPVHTGQQGLVQVCSALPTSYPGYLVLTDDIAEVFGYDGCPCGRRGIRFRFVKRVPKVEIRGCGNIETVRQRPRAPSNHV